MKPVTAKLIRCGIFLALILAGLAGAIMVGSGMMRRKEQLAARREDFVARLRDHARRSIETYYSGFEKLPQSFSEIRPFCPVEVEMINEGIDLGYAGRDIVKMNIPGTFDAALRECIPLEEEWKARIQAFEREVAKLDGDLRAQLMLYARTDQFGGLSFLEGLVKRGASEADLKLFADYSGDASEAEQILEFLEERVFVGPALGEKNLLVLRIIAWNHRMDGNLWAGDAEELQSYYRDKAGQLTWPDDSAKYDIVPDFSTSPKAGNGFVAWARYAAEHCQARQDMATTIEKIVSSVRPAGGTTAPATRPNP